MKNIRLEILALCNYASFSKDGKLNINGIFDEIYANKFPSSLLRAFLVLTLSDIKPGKTTHLDIDISDPQGKSTFNNKIVLKAGRNGKGNFNAELIGMPLPKKGVYKISVKHKGNELGFTKFTVGPSKANGQTKKRTTRLSN
jgi:uncharacterized protein YfaP (DUF2135 family)